MFNQLAPVVRPFRSVARMIVRFLDPVEVEQSDWYYFSESLPPARFLVWLANEISLELYLQGTDADHVGSLQAEAEQFLVHRYSITGSTPDRLVLVFRQVLARRMRHTLPRLV
jgi:hypothetical protein